MIKFGILATVLGLSHLLAGTSLAQETNVPLARPAKLIDIAAIDPVTKISLPSIIAPSVTADLTMLVGGVLKDLPVQEGQSIAKGALIAQLDTVTLQNAVDQAQAQYENAQIEFKRAETLVKRKALSKTVYDQRKSARDLAKLETDAAKTQLEHATLYAPFNGVIAKVNVNQFQTISPSTAIVTIQSKSQFEAIVDIPAKMIANSNNIEVEQTSIILDVLPSISIPVTFKQIAPQADPTTQTYEVRFDFNAPDGLLVLDGMTGELHSTLRTTGDAAAALTIQIPLASVLYDGTNPYVWRVDTAAMTVSKTQITLGDAIGNMLPVSAGLQAGDTIVGAGASYLHEGMIIRRFVQ